jgi:hypothetical protein
MKRFISYDVLRRCQLLVYRLMKDELRVVWKETVLA